MPLALRNEPDKWAVTLDDDFTDPERFARDWEKVTSAGDKTKTLRLPENDVLGRQGLELRLSDNDGDRREELPFTGGYVEAAQFQQCYGYFECEMRIAAEEGVNNAFWLVSEPGDAADANFELDVAEAKFPSEVQVNARLWRPRHLVRSRTAQMGFRLSESFHRYGLLWSPEAFRFFFDDVDIFDAVNDIAHSPAIIRISNAVADFAGEDDGDVSGSATVIRRVRVLQKAEWRDLSNASGGAK